MIGHLILRLTIWFLLTANLSPENIVIGLAIAFLLPRSYPSKENLKEWLIVLWKIAKAVPIAYIEAFEMIFRPHKEEAIVREKVSSDRSSTLIFLDVFLITFTPKTIVLKYQERGWYIVHRVQRVQRRLKS